MNLQYFFDQLVDTPHPDLEATVDTLLTIWLRTLYGTDSAGGDAAAQR